MTKGTKKRKKYTCEECGQDTHILYGMWCEACEMEDREKDNKKT